MRLLPGVPLVESPLFAASLDAMELDETERAIAVQLNTRGYAVLDFPDFDIDTRIERIKVNLMPRYAVDVTDPTVLARGGDLRVQDAWTFNDDVRSVAANPVLLDLLSKLYGRRAFPFQTLNFPVGTQQAAHADAIHSPASPNASCAACDWRWRTSPPTAGRWSTIPARTNGRSSAMR